MRADMKWWIMLARSWNGKSFFLESAWTPSPAFQLFTDASDQGYGCYWQGHWLQGTWSRQQSKFHIQWKELFAVVVAAQTWGAQWTRKRLLVHCDNHAVVDIWQADTSRSPALMKLVRSLFFTAAQHNFTLILQHIQGVNNAIADAPSHSDAPIQRAGSTGRQTTHSHPCHSDHQLTYHLAALQEKGIADSTHRTYRAGCNHFVTFCSSCDISPWPASETTLRYYCAHASKTLSHSSLLVYLAAIRHAHLQQGLSDPLLHGPQLSSPHSPLQS